MRRSYALFSIARLVRKSFAANKEGIWECGKGKEYKQVLRRHMRNEEMIGDHELLSNDLLLVKDKITTAISA